jgi:hypothetical protein
VRRRERLAAGVAGIAGVGLGAALVLGGVRQPDVLTAVTHAALGVAVAACGVVILLGGAVGFAAAMSGIAVTLAVAGFVVGGPLGIAAGVLGAAALFAGAVAYASENYGIFAYALLGDGLATAALGFHHLRTDATMLGVTLLVAAVLSLGTAAVVGKAAQ